MFRRYTPGVVSTLVVACLLTPSCSRQQEAPHSSGVKSSSAALFAYDQTAGVPVTVDSERVENGILIRSAHFTAHAAGQRQVTYSLIRPAASGSYAGIVFFHWLGRPKGDRSEFFEEAVALAQKGVVSLLIQGYFPWSQDPVNGATDRQEIIRQTIDVQRALSILLREPSIDPGRIAYVGHDYGAMFGAITAGLERRVKAYVFVAGMGTFADWSLKYWPATAAAGENAYREAIDPVDPIHFVPHAAPAALLFQFATRDKYISRDVARTFSDAASEPKTVRWYDTTHDMFAPDVARDRHAWLEEQLGLPR